MGRDEKITLSVSEAAAVLGVSRPTVYRLIRQSDFPVFRVGTRQLISRSGLETWVERQIKKENCDG